MNNDIIIKGVGSFDRDFVKSMSKGEWVRYMNEVNPKFKQAEEVWLQANPALQKISTPKKKKQDEPSNDQL